MSSSVRSAGSSSAAAAAQRSSRSARSEALKSKLENALREHQYNSSLTMGSGVDGGVVIHPPAITASTGSGASEMMQQQEVTQQSFPGGRRVSATSEYSRESESSRQQQDDIGRAARSKYLTSAYSTATTSKRSLDSASTDGEDDGIYDQIHEALDMEESKTRLTEGEIDNIDGSADRRRAREHALCFAWLEDDKYEDEEEDEADNRGRSSLFAQSDHNDDDNNTTRSANASLLHTDRDRDRERENAPADAHNANASRCGRRISSGWTSLGISISSNLGRDFGELAAAPFSPSSEKIAQQSGQFMSRLGSIGKSVGAAVGTTVGSAVESAKNTLQQQQQQQQQQQSTSPCPPRRSINSSVDGKDVVPATIPEDDTLFNKLALKRFNLARLVDETVPNAERLEGNDGSVSSNIVLRDKSKSTTRPSDDNKAHAKATDSTIRDHLWDSSGFDHPEGAVARNFVEGGLKDGSSSGDGRSRYAPTRQRRSSKTHDSDDEIIDDDDAQSVHSYASSVLSKVEEWRKEYRSGAQSVGGTKDTSTRRRDSAATPPGEVAVRPVQQRKISSKKMDALDLAAMKLARFEPTKKRSSFGGNSVGSRGKSATNNTSRRQSDRLNGQGGTWNFDRMESSHSARSASTTGEIVAPGHDIDIPTDGRAARKSEG